MGSILQYFRPSLSCQLLLRYLFCLFLSGRFTQVLLYVVSLLLKVFAESRANIWPVKLIKTLRWLRLLSVLRRWFCYCLSAVYCCCHCLWEYCVWSLFYWSVLCALSTLFQFCNYPYREKKACCLTFIVFSMLCCCYCSLPLPRSACVWLWHFLVMLTVVPAKSDSDVVF